MMSMTGFGRAEIKSTLGRLTVEITSVNNRFLETSVRLPRQFASLEAQVRELTTSMVERGKVTLYISHEMPDDAAASSHINVHAARSFTKQLRQLKKELKLTGNVSLTDLLVLPDVIKPASEEINPEEAWPPLKEVVTKALKNLVTMRGREGKAMAKDMADRLDSLDSIVKQIQEKTIGAVDYYRDKLTKRINELMESPARDSVRLEEEIAIFAERTDIAEELMRFGSHCEQYREALKQSEASGRKLNFILQEMNREANTIGSKSVDFAIASLVISLKEEIERLRELVQNVE